LALPPFVVVVVVEVVTVVVTVGVTHHCLCHPDMDTLLFSSSFWHGHAAVIVFINLVWMQCWR